MRSIATEICIFALSLLLLAGCGAEQKALGEALGLAGENGVELRRVLEHYRDDPMKLREVPPDLEKRRLVLLTLCGFSYRHIALLPDATPANVSARLTRLKQKCAGYGNPAAERCVDCIRM